MKRYGSPYDSEVESAYTKAVCNYPEYQYLIEDFINWLRIRYGAKLKLVGVQPMNKGGMLLPNIKEMPCENRWSETYLRRRIARLYCIDDWMKDNNIGKTTMMTLTLSHGSENSLCGPISIPQAFELLKRHVRLIQNRIAVEMPGLQCVVVYEPHTKGYFPGFPHVHVLYFGVIPDKLQEQVKRLWSDKYKLGSYERGITFEVSKDNLQSGRNYVMKYLWKQLMSGFTDPSVILFNAVAWKHRYRLFSMSPGLNEYADQVWADKIQQKYNSDDDLDRDDVPPVVTHCKTFVCRDDWVNPVREVKIPRAGKYGNSTPKKVRAYAKKAELLETAINNLDSLSFGGLPKPTINSSSTDPEWLHKMVKNWNN